MCPNWINYFWKGLKMSNALSMFLSLFVIQRPALFHCAILKQEDLSGRTSESLKLPVKYVNFYFQKCNSVILNNQFHYPTSIPLPTCNCQITNLTFIPTYISIIISNLSTFQQFVKKSCDINSYWTSMIHTVLGGESLRVKLCKVTKPKLFTFIFY